MPWLLCSALCVACRPSSALFWAVIGMWSLWEEKRLAGRVALAAQAMGIGTAVLGAVGVVDRYGYGRWVIVPLEFFKFNLLEGKSALYGTHSWHWNLTQGLPAVLLTFLPVFMLGCEKRYVLSCLCNGL